jgi:hypothetical protein
MDTHADPYRQAIGRKASLARWHKNGGGDSQAELDAAVWVMRAERMIQKLNADAPLITAAQRERLLVSLGDALATHLAVTADAESGDAS